MRRRTAGVDLFKGRHFDQEIIVLCVRWYLSFKLSSRDLVQIMSERVIALAHTTILRWVQRYVPEFEKRWNRYARPVNGSWRCDETYIKVGNSGFVVGEKAHRKRYAKCRSSRNPGKPRVSIGAWKSLDEQLSTFPHFVQRRR